MDCFEERMSQPPAPRCQSGCLPGSCYCTERLADQLMDQAMQLDRLITDMQKTVEAMRG